MPRKNHRRSRPQARRYAETFAPVARPPIEKAILPHGRCYLPHAKLKFHAHEAQAALAQAQALRRSRGQLLHMEKRVYECDSCGAWHLTSRTEWVQR